MAYLSTSTARRFHWRLDAPARRDWIVEKMIQCTKSDFCGEEAEISRRVEGVQMPWFEEMRRNGVFHISEPYAAWFTDTRLWSTYISKIKPCPFAMPPDERVAFKAPYFQDYHLYLVGYITSSMSIVAEIQNSLNSTTPASGHRSRAFSSTTFEVQSPVNKRSSHRTQLAPDDGPEESLSDIEGKRSRAESIASVQNGYKHDGMSFSTTPSSQKRSTGSTERWSSTETLNNALGRATRLLHQSAGVDWGKTKSFSTFSRGHFDDTTKPMDRNDRPGPNPYVEWNDPTRENHDLDEGDMIEIAEHGLQRNIPRNETRYLEEKPYRKSTQGLKSHTLRNQPISRQTLRNGRKQKQVEEAAPSEFAIQAARAAWENDPSYGQQHFVPPPKRESWLSRAIRR